MEKIKYFINEKILSEKGKDILVVIIVILVGLASFELGRLSKSTPAGLKIEYPSQSGIQEANTISVNSVVGLPNGNPTTELNSVTKKFFASNRGSKYYSIGCSAGKTIKQENRVYFSTREEAEKAGYVLSTSCK